MPFFTKLYTQVSSAGFTWLFIARLPVFILSVSPSVCFFLHFAETSCDALLGFFSEVVLHTVSPNCSYSAVLFRPHHSHTHTHRRATHKGGRRIRRRRVPSTSTPDVAHYTTALLISKCWLIFFT